MLDSFRQKPELQLSKVEPARQNRRDVSAESAVMSVRNKADQISVIYRDDKPALSTDQALS